VLEMSVLAPIADKLGKLLRLLTSHCDGEVVAAGRAIERALKNAGLDIRALAAVVEDDVQSGAGNRNGPSWHDIAFGCTAKSHWLPDDWERAFVADTVRWTVYGSEPTLKLAEWLRSIYVRSTWR
jgi:hypothetical protein